VPVQLSSPPVQLSSPPVQLSSPPVQLSSPVQRRCRHRFRMRRQQGPAQGLR